MNKYLRISVLVIMSIVAALLLAEVLARLVFDPIDFLKPRRIPDEILGYKIQPHSGAHDSWGYRNKYVPDRADIVAIGDSHTYGISATTNDSWPSVLQKISGKETYNISLGGYGPADYLYLLQKSAFSLDPNIIIVGLYLGNDLKNAFTDVYSIPIWEDLRLNEKQFDNIKPDSIRDKPGLGIGDYLAGHSVIYRLMSSSLIGDYLRQKRRLIQGEEILMFEDEETGITTGFTPDERLEGLDLNNPQIAEGLRLTLEIFNQMNEISRENDTEFLVLIIPTKESVYSEVVKGDIELANSAELNLLVANEKRANQIIRDYFDRHSIQYIDLLDPLMKAAATEQLYPRNFGGHSNKNGYRIFAETINQYLQTKSTFQ